MAKRTLTVGVDTRLLDMMVGLDKSLTIRTALVNLFKLDPLTLIPLADIALEQENRKRQADLEMKMKLNPPKSKSPPKTYAACVDDDEKAAFKENEGYKLGADEGFPHMWLKLKPNPHSAAHPTLSYWHYDPEVMAEHRAAYEVKCAKIMKATMISHAKVVEAIPVEIDEDYVMACAGIPNEDEPS